MDELRDEVDGNEKLKKRAVKRESKANIEETSDEEE